VFPEEKEAARRGKQRALLQTITKAPRRKPATTSWKKAACLATPLQGKEEGAEEEEEIDLLRGRKKKGREKMLARKIRRSSHKSRILFGGVYFTSLLRVSNRISREKESLSRGRVYSLASRKTAEKTKTDLLIRKKRLLLCQREKTPVSTGGTRRLRRASVTGGGGGEG